MSFQRRLHLVVGVVVMSVGVASSALAQTKPSVPAAAPSEAVLADSESPEEAVAKAKVDRPASGGPTTDTPETDDAKAKPSAPQGAAEVGEPRDPASRTPTSEDGAPRDWLAPDAGTGVVGEDEPSAPSAWRIVLMLLLISGLVGWAAYSRFKKNQGGVVVDAKVKVLGSARVGPKAYAVVTSVGGRSFLLGVTDGSVSLLSTLDSLDEPINEAPTDTELDDEAQEDDPALRTPGQAVTLEQRFATASYIAPSTAAEVRRPAPRATSARSPQQRPTRPARSTRPSSAAERKPSAAEVLGASSDKRSSFGDLLMSALRKPEPSPTEPASNEAAPQLASLTRDVVTVSDPVLIRQKVEGQAAGLAARLRGH